VSFRGFPPECVEFFEDLEAHNDREWFRAHKDVYEQACLHPMEQLLAELEPQFGDGKIFRIYRDVRFSKDKSPYKTYIAATFGQGYISLSAESFSVATGAYMLDTQGVRSYRDAVAEDSSGAKLEEITSVLERKGYQLGGHESLKTTPKGYPKDHPRARWLREKGLHVWKSFEPGPWLGTRKPLEHVKTVLRDARPLNDWLEAYVRP
jgi:uncharacterized protein (TIGR02453 family)